MVGFYIFLSFFDRLDTAVGKESFYMEYYKDFCNIVTCMACYRVREDRGHRLEAGMVRKGHMGTDRMVCTACTVGTAEADKV